MSDDNDKISRQTWSRVIEPVTKAGYMDGAADGQTAVFQQSFNTGYEQGLLFGLELGFKEALSRIQQRTDSRRRNLEDPRRINCQICSNGVQLQENIGNLYNIQKERNAEYLTS